MNSFHKLALMAAMLGGMGGTSFGDRGTVSKAYDEPPTDAQRRMFTQPVKLNKRQKALQKKRNR